MTLQEETIINTPIGNLKIICHSSRIKKIEILSQPENNQANKSISCEVSTQFENYFANSRYQFMLAADPDGTPFQKQIWQHLLTIPSGETRTYGQIAKALNSSPRAVGQACRRNPIPIIIPCHRVVAEKELGGYFGKTTGDFPNIKKWLLEHEKVCL